MSDRIFGLSGYPVSSSIAVKAMIAGDCNLSHVWMHANIINRYAHTLPAYDEGDVRSTLPSQLLPRNLLGSCCPSHVLIRTLSLHSIGLGWGVMMRVHAYIFHLLTHAEGTCRRKWVDCILICRQLTSLHKKTCAGPMRCLQSEI